MDRTMDNGFAEAGADIKRDWEMTTHMHRGCDHGKCRGHGNEVLGIGRQGEVVGSGDYHRGGISLYYVCGGKIMQIT
jgi:hypothetical protein